MAYSQPASSDSFADVDLELLRTGQSVARHVPNREKRKRDQVLAKSFRKRARSLTPPPTLPAEEHSSQVYVDAVSKLHEDNFLHMGPTGRQTAPDFQYRR